VGGYIVPILLSTSQSIERGKREHVLPIEFEIKVVAVSGSLRMTIPKEVARALSIEAGDTVLVGVNDHTMLVRRRKRS
jgi:AbrB family looped-hinge helix DNA binding protein